MAYMKCLRFRCVVYYPSEMPGSQKGHSQGKWDVSALKCAVSAVNLLKMSVKSAAKQHGIPKCVDRKKTVTKRKVAHAEVITKSPYKDGLRQAKEMKLMKEEQAKTKALKKQTKISQPVVKKKSVKVKTKVKPTAKGKQKKVSITDTSNPQCLYCSAYFLDSRITEQWIQCEGDCHEWAHTDCAGVTKRDKHFTCEICVE